MATPSETTETALSDEAIAQRARESVERLLWRDLQLLFHEDLRRAEAQYGNSPRRVGSALHVRSLSPSTSTTTSHYASLKTPPTPPNPRLSLGSWIRRLSNFCSALSWFALLWLVLLEPFYIEINGGELVKLGASPHTPSSFRNVISGPLWNAMYACGLVSNRWISVACVFNPHECVRAIVAADSPVVPTEKKQAVETRAERSSVPVGYSKYSAWAVLSKQPGFMHPYQRHMSPSTMSIKNKKVILLSRFHSEAFHVLPVEAPPSAPVNRSHAGGTGTGLRLNDYKAATFIGRRIGSERQ